MTNLNFLSKVKTFCVIVTVILMVNIAVAQQNHLPNNNSNNKGTTIKMDKNRMELSNKKYQELVGKLPEPDKESDPELMEILRKFIFGEVFHTGNLDDKSRELITIVALTVNQTLPQLKSHTNCALNIGVTPIEIRETVYQCAPFIGFPKTLNAVNTINEVFVQRKIILPLEKQGTVNEKERFAKGNEIQTPLYGNEIKENLNDIHGDLNGVIPAFLTEFCFGDFYTRKGLSVAKRELLILCLLAAEGAERQLKSHATGNLKAGNNKETMLSAMIHLIPYIGFPKALNAVNIIKDLDEKSVEQNKDNLQNENSPKGVKGSSEWFSGTVFVQPLVNPQDVEGFYSVGRVTFEPGGKTHWPTHPAGQILLVTDGKGWYQERNKPARPLIKGDVVTIPKDVEHWHGAALDSQFVHIAVTNRKNGNNVIWLNPVTDEEYKSLLKQ
jgi:4-carboxymuconolactone decarboxylase